MTSPFRATAPHRILIGTAGWSVPRDVAGLFPADGTHLMRYAACLGAAEINSSFYRPHRRTTYERWAASVPPGFRFSVKLPKTISHASTGHQALVERFAAEVQGLGDKLGALLVQFPPKRVFEAIEASTLFGLLAAAFDCPVVCEPRHPSWFTAAAEALLVDHRIARVAADPSPVAGGGEPGGWPGLRYYRLHGAPRIYYSSYDDMALAALHDTLAAPASAETWCIFDNTAASAAAGNAMALARRLA